MYLLLSRRPKLNLDLQQENVTFCDSVLLRQLASFPDLCNLDDILTLRLYCISGIETRAHDSSGIELLSVYPSNLETRGLSLY